MSFEPKSLTLMGRMGQEMDMRRYAILFCSSILWACEPREEIPQRELSTLETERLAPAIMPSVKVCHDEVKSMFSSRPSKLELVFRISSKGRAKAYTESAPTDFSKAIVDCVNKKMKPIELDLPEGSSGGTLAFDLSDE